MLGDLLGEAKGRTTGIRVLSANGPELEVSFGQSGTSVGVEITELGTFASAPKAGGVLHGHGHGVLMTKDGEVATWTGSGIGKPNANSGNSWRGAILYESTSSKLARLNGVVGVFEFETDADGNTSAKVWEWK